MKNGTPFIHSGNIPVHDHNGEVVAIFPFDVNAGIMMDDAGNNAFIFRFACWLLLDEEFKKSEQYAKWMHGFNQYEHESVVAGDDKDLD
jgi:hypothetical protein